MALEQIRRLTGMPRDDDGDGVPLLLLAVLELLRAHAGFARRFRALKRGMSIRHVAVPCGHEPCANDLTREKSYARDTTAV